MQFGRWGETDDGKERKMERECCSRRWKRDGGERVNYSMEKGVERNGM